MSKMSTGFYTLVVSFILLSFTNLSSQPAIRFATQRTSDAEDLVYSQHFKSYTIGTLSTQATSDLLRSQNYFDVLEIDVKGKTFQVSLEARDLRPAHYKLRVQDENGIHEMPRSPNKTYKGYTTTGHHNVRVTADDNFFYALIEQGNDAFYIEPARNILSSAPEDQFVMYWESDNLKKFSDASCGVGPSHTHQHHPEEIIPSAGETDNRLVVCKVVQIALANDFEMFQEQGSVDDVEDHNMAVINNVETNYDNEFSTDLQFDIVEIYVATSNATDPWTNSTNSNTLLDDFTNWGPNGFDNTHDVGALWTNRDFDGDIIGLAWLDAICTGHRYHTVQDFTGNAALLRCLQAHEMGHNFSADHDAAGSPHIMAPSVQNTNTWSPASINAINAYIPTRVCLTNCSAGAPPIADFEADDTEGCVSFTVDFTDESANSPTSWSWVFPGGVPSTSSLQNPTVTYNNAGVYNVTLTVTNAQGSNSLTEQDYITVGDDPFADFDFSIDDLEVDFENQSEGAVSYNWNFGDGGTSTLENPIHVYDEDGVY